MSFIFYRRPPHVSRPAGPVDNAMCQAIAQKMAKYRVPDELSFERLIAGHLLPPVQLQDFMDYLVFIAHDAENLQFFLWLRDYRTHFDALPEAQKKLSPKLETQKPTLGVASATTTAAVARPPSLSEDAKASQPFREEIERIVATYISPGSPRELNISSAERDKVLSDLNQTTEPSVFEPVGRIAESVLRNQTYPNFVRYAICNGNKPRIVAIQTSAIIMVVLAVVAIVVLMLSSVSRWLRIAVMPLAFIGFVGIVSAGRGLCVILTVQNVQQPSTWHLSHEESVVMAELGKGYYCPMASDKSSVTSSSNMSAGDSSIDAAMKQQHRNSSGLFDHFGPDNSGLSSAFEEVEKNRKRQSGVSFSSRLSGQFSKIQATGQVVRNDTIHSLRMGIIARCHIEALVLAVVMGVVAVVLPSVGLF